MTLKELLCTIPFEKIEPHIALLYPDMATPRMLELFRSHYKLLCRLIPRVAESEEPCIITMTKGEENETPFLDAYNIEGCDWEEALSKVMSEKVCKILLVLALMLGVPQA